MRVCIVGGGASGLVCALSAKNKNNEVIILEKNNELGKKILLTGNGKCNYWNLDMNLKHYHSETDIRDYLNDDLINEGIKFFDDLGIEPKIKNGYFYPFSGSAKTIRDTLVNEVEKNNIRVVTNYQVKSIKKDEISFIINDEIRSDIIVIATGGMSYPSTGSTGDGYKILEYFHHAIRKPLPSLVALKSDDPIKTWDGVRSDVKLNLYIDGEYIKSEVGELQLTNYGISGICVFNLSSYVVRALDEGKKVNIKIDFLPFLSNMDTSKYLSSKNKNISLKEMLNRILNNKIVDVIIDKLDIDNNKSISDLNNKEMSKLVKYLREFSINIIGSNDFNNCQVTSGGMFLDEVNKDFSSVIVPSLYIIGEVLDVDGDCGGYNLGFAWMSAISAGKSIREIK